MKLLKKLPVVYNHRKSLPELLESADLVISDGSGAIFDSIATKTPVLVYNMKIYQSIDNDKSLPIEEEIIKKDLVLSFDEANQLEEKIELLLSEKGKKYIQSLDSLYQQFFTCLPRQGVKKIFQLFDQLLDGKVDITNYQIAKQVLIDQSEQYLQLPLLQQQVHELNQKLLEKEQFITEILNSRSWRYTKIFRNKK